jgi:hypothetical protein
MAWVEVFAAFVVCHLAGDYLLQTDWQAKHKRGGLGSDPIARRALFSHVATYTLAFVPAFVWIAGEVGAGLLIAAVALVALPHLVQDDGRLLTAYMETVKGGEVPDNLGVAAAVDQSFHFLTLFGIALLVGS